MSDDKQNQGNQAAGTLASPAVPPPVLPPAQAANTGKPSEAPFALDPHLIGEIQEGEGKPEHTAVVRPEIVRNKPTKKK